MRRVIAFSFFVCVLAAVRAVGQYKFRLIDVVDGLSDNQIRGLSMTPDRRIGVRTASILNIYDGTSFEHFPYDKDRKYVWSYTRPPKEYYDAKGRVWMKELYYLLLLDLKTNTFNYDIQDELAAMGVKGRLKNLFIDESKNYWFVTEDNTLYFYDIEKREGRVVDDGRSKFTQKYGVPFEMAQYKNYCWIVYSSGLIRCWDYVSSEFIFQDTRFLGTIDEYTDRLYLHPDDTGNLWLMYNDGIYFYNRMHSEWKSVATISGMPNFFTCMDLDKDGNVWAGTSRSGLCFIDRETFGITSVPDMPMVNGGVLDNDIYTILVDDNNGLWVGTLFQGLCYYHPAMQKFRLVQTGSGSSYITNETVRSFLENEDGSILIGSRNGLFRFIPATGKVERLCKDEISDLVISLYRDRKGTVWVGTFLNGFYKICEGRACKPISTSTSASKSGVAPTVGRGMYEDVRGRYWVSVNEGVGRFDPETGRVTEMLSERHPELKDFRLVHAFYPYGEDGFVAVATNGMFYYDTKNDRVRIPNEKTDRYYKADIKYFGYLEDKRGLEWFATEDGIRIWDAKKSRLYLLTVEDGLSNNAVSSLLEDEEGVVWASTLNGICKIVLGREEGDYKFSIVNFDVSDGLQSGIFYACSALKDRNGMLYFGGAHGVNYINPKETVAEGCAGTPLLTGLSIFNTPVDVNAEYNGRVVLKETLSRTEEIALRHNENFIALEFSGLNYANPSHTYYKYKLFNFDEKWVESLAVNAGRAVYTNLRPGKYRFEVYAANGDKVWSKHPAVLTIVVKPPFWATYWAMAFYVLVLGCLVYYLFRLYRQKEQVRMLEEQRESARRQQENLEQMKLRFFTNISHEFRTPLTLILTPLGAIIRSLEDGELKSKLNVVYRNAGKLLGLVNQLLDFRKLEMQGEQLLPAMGDMVRFMREAVEAFRQLTTERKIELIYESETDHLYMNYDHDKVYKIINNLMSNAVKFTPQEGSIVVKVRSVLRGQRNCVAVSVADTGCGIEEKNLKLIFTRFYQVEHGKSGESGSGIGLHLVKGYVDLHEGEILVESRPGAGTTFTVYLPTDLQGEEKQSSALDEHVEEQTEGEQEQELVENGRKKILIVEDNTEFRTFLAEELSTDFEVMEAEDGLVGEEQALARYPDLIISDLMMPRRDGVEFCQRMKNDIHTSHIPFILLTAKRTEDARIESYRAGADSYISKPFNLEMLRVRINKLIGQRERRIETFHKTVSITPESITTTSLDEEFVKKALKCVEDNMDNTEYSLDDLSTSLGLSKTHLNRKLAAIVNMRPLQFIRSVRLKRAAQLLADSQYNVNEIADMVGFNTLKYFNRYFKEEFGMTPTAYREKNRKS